MQWDDARAHAAPIRLVVFVDEQRVPAELEMDENDAACVHAIAFDGARAVGTGRLLPDGRIGRMAVIVEWRRRGIGAEILEALIVEAGKRGHKEVLLSAQLQAAEFYRTHGFVAEGKVFEEAGILHQHMHKTL